MDENDLISEDFEEENDKVKFVWDDDAKQVVLFLSYCAIIFIILNYTRMWYEEHSDVNILSMYFGFAIVIGMTYMILSVIFMPRGETMQMWTFVFTLAIATTILVAGVATYPDRMENRQETLDEYRVINLSDINAVIEYNVSMYNIHFYEDGNFVIEQYADENIERQIFEYQTDGDMIFHNDRSIEESYIRITNVENDLYEIVYLYLPIQSRW